jgi:hypothetical protein
MNKEELSAEIKKKTGPSVLLIALAICCFGALDIRCEEPSCLNVSKAKECAAPIEGSCPGPMKINRVTDEAAPSRKERGNGDPASRANLKLADGPPNICSDAPRSVKLVQMPPAPVPKLSRNEFAAVGIPSHYAGFVTNYPHIDGPSYNYYNTANEKMPLWGVASGAPAPGVENAMWIGGDYDQDIEDECPAGGGCYVAPPIDGVYRGWRAQGDSSAPCSCPAVIQRCYFSANRGISMFDLSYIPDKATVNSVSLEGVVAKQFGTAGLGERINISQVDVDRSAGMENLPGTGFQFTYDDASMGHLYTTNWAVSGYAVGNPVSVTLNTTARTDVKAALQRNWFGLGLVSGAGETYTTAYYFGALSGSASADPPYLVVDYTYIIPDAPALVSTPASEVTGDGELTCAPALAWDIPDEAGAKPLHFKVALSDTVPVHVVEDFTSSSRIDWGLTDYYDMVKTASHDIYDETGVYVSTDPPQVRLDPLELIYGGGAYPYARNYNVGWRFSRPFVSHLATDTYTAGGYTPDGLGDAMMGFPYMEWSSDSAISYPNTACATELGYPANVTSLGGYIPSGITESFEVSFEYDGDPGNYYSVGTISDVSGSFFATVDPPAENVTGIALFFTDSNDGYAYLADLQVFDMDIYDTSVAQTVTAAVVASSGNPGHVIRHATLTAADEQPAGTAVTYEISNDNGSTWYTVSSGSDFVFPTDGNQLRWRAALSTSSRSLTPRIFGVTVDNLLGGAPVDSAANLVRFEENATLGGTFQTIPAAGAPEHSSTWYQARYRPLGLADGTWYWKTEAYAPAGTTDSGLASSVWSFTLDTSTLPSPLGDVLRAALNSETSVTLDWSLAPPNPGVHYHVYRSETADLPGTLLGQPVAAVFTDDTAAAPLLFYRIRAADDCGRESADY